MSNVSQAVTVVAKDIRNVTRSDQVVSRAPFENSSVIILHLLNGQPGNQVSEPRQQKPTGSKIANLKPPRHHRPKSRLSMTPHGRRH